MCRTRGSIAVPLDSQATSLLTEIAPGLALFIVITCIVSLLFWHLIIYFSLFTSLFILMILLPPFFSVTLSFVSPFSWLSLLSLHLLSPFFSVTFSFVSPYSCLSLFSLYYCLPSFMSPYPLSPLSYFSL